MSEAHAPHLRDLKIQGFRGIDNLHLPRLGRITLLAGRNGIGKTTVLEAVRVYAARGDHPVLRELLLDREEFSRDDGEEDQISVPDVDALFFGRGDALDASLSIGPSASGDQLRIDLASQEEMHAFLRHRQRIRATDMWLAEGRSGVKVSFGQQSKICPLGFPFRVPTRNRFTASKIGMTCESVGPGTLTNQELVSYWDSISLSDYAKTAIGSLNFMLRSIQIQDSVIKVDAPEVGQGGRRMMVRLKSQHHPIPLRSLGDGALRVFGVVLALTNSRGGFLVIDEVENGLHYSVQREFWRTVMRTAEASNVQVLATTHSSDCISGFAQAALESSDVEGILYRLSRRNGHLRAVEYPEDELKTAADQHIEVR